ncbi:helix-turn-helix domain-containing protein [Jiella endophytica]|uniref:Helix-turn-helix domain-containing protein n=1 Tax=Jiella endophytica TaxID=2558362 RepID=A0A4Y8RD81_9HYPH|nr:helix-turn-helix domain-containing protein [Jiella endophytica]TFF19124.1 helix-turn-helix domain-containing protein [Jiella endophytica]
MTRHHYVESGLDNVYIEGIAVERDANGEEMVTIPAVNQLHRIISVAIISHPKGISGPELRFLRSEMGLTQAELAAIVHRDKQSIGRWERNEIEIDPTAETLIRRMAIEKLKLPVDVGIELLAQRSVPTAEAQPITIRAADGGTAGYSLAA